jgi:Fic family protein
MKIYEEEIGYKYIHLSYAIEGNTMSFPQVQEFLRTGYALSTTIVLKDLLEVYGLNYVFKYIKGIANNTSQPFIWTEEFIKDLHFKFFHFIDLKQAGCYRTTNVRVGHHEAPHYQDAPILMDKLVKWMNSENFGNLHPVEQAA